MILRNDGIIIIEKEVMTMTNEEKFRKGIVIYKTDDDVVCELWGASTKHPDSKFYYSEWGDRTDLFDDKYQIFQWLLWIASKRQFPFHAKELTEYALKNWYNWE